jgi:CRISPR-associated endonuclease/helicase Cas3
MEFPRYPGVLAVTWNWHRYGAGFGGSVQWAHSASANGRWHRLDDHLVDTGELAGEFAAPFGATSLTRWLGRVHDLGKAPCAWQEALVSAASTGRATGVRHKEHAARLAGRELVRTAGGKVAAVIAASALLGHHSGIPDLSSGDAGARSTRDALTEGALDEEISAAVEALQSTLGDLVVEAHDVDLPSWLPIDASGTDPVSIRRLEMFTRMAHSALVDADFLDTQRHFSDSAQPRVAPAEDFALLSSDFASARANLVTGRLATAVGRVRESVYEQAMSYAQNPPGMFRLPAPTGSGKTLTAMGFALQHAAANGLRRVVVAVPFTSITTQNAQVYREMLDRPGLPRVLEHHSAVLDGDAGSSRWRRLAAENWDAPVVVTTTVQLFESLLSNRPSHTRKLHRLAGSVIVLDEVQSLPMSLLPVILDVLRTLVDDYGATVVLSTATQPQFWAMPVWAGFPSTSLLPQEQAVRSSLRRVSYEWRLGQPKPTWPEVAGWLAAERQALAIVNTTKDAQSLHRATLDAVQPGSTVLHLSTRMCGAHRLDTLARVRGLLDDGDQVLLVSTQVVEAGVDVDFPAVFRAIGPPESIAQAAGRANREGRLAGLGRVVVFDPADGGLPGAEYRTATELARQGFAAPAIDPDDVTALATYYEDLYAKLLPGGASGRGTAISRARESFKFRETASLFRMIDDAGVPVIVEYDDPHQHAAGLIARLRAGGSLDPQEWRFLQTRTATLSRAVAAKAVAAGLAADVTPPAKDGQSGRVLAWQGRYDDLRGIDPNEPTNAEEVIW